MNGRKKIKVLAKRALSVFTAMALLSGSLPLGEISDKLNIFNTALVAHSVDDYSKNPTLYSAQNIIDYSKAYREYPQNHYDDNITINRSDDLANTSFDGFLSLGTAEYPFAGTITFNATATHDINIDTAFFDYVYDYVTIEGGVDAGVNKYMTIKPLNDNADALLANHVLHDDGTKTNVVYGTDEGQKTPASWTIEIAGYDGTSHTHGSLIGEMGENAECTVNLINSYSVSVENNIGSGDNAIKDTGAVCGIMQNGSKLTIASVTGNAAESIRSSGGNAGGLVGTMRSGSVLIISGASGDYVSNTSDITASNGYAGGIVGYNEQATVSGVYVAIKNTITGSMGAGGLYGYYKPIMVSDVYRLSLDRFTIGDSSKKCSVSSPIGAGGFFGVLDNPGGTVTFNGSDDHPIYVKGDGDNTIFGGVIGSYKADSLDDTLSVGGYSGNMLTVDTGKTGNLSYYGGIVGKIDGAYFASISDVNINAANTNDEYFGGAVACADSGYVYVNNLTLLASLYRGGAVVGHTSNGVVHIAGTTDISSAVSDSGNNYGQIVGYRDSALVFAENGWNLTRNTTTAVEADDIGSWGEVVRFKASDFTIGSVLSTYYVPSDETPYHYATLRGTMLSGGKIVLSSKSTFATAALNMQLNGGADTAVLNFSDKTNCSYDTLKTKSITMTSDVDLSHTGMTGLTRDNGRRTQYFGSEFDGGGAALTLSIGEGYEGDDTTSPDSVGKGMIYRHTYNGLFGETAENFTVKNVTISGKVHTNDKIGDTNVYYVGTVAGKAAKQFNADAVTVDSGTSIKYGTNTDGKDTLYVGGLVGMMSAPGISTIGRTAASGNTDSTFSADISGRAAVGEVYIGGVCGYVAGGTVNVHDIKITNSISNGAARETQNIGGLFATVSGGTLDLNGVETNALTVKGKMRSGGSMGGLLGYNWDGVHVTFDNIDINSCIVNNDTSSGNQAALIYTGSGCWKYKDVTISGLTLTGSSASSFGMLVNKAYSGKKAMYLELPSGFNYTINGVTGAAPSIYDEIAVYTFMPDNTIEANGNSIISINTNRTTRYGTLSDSMVNMTSGNCNTYQNQVTITGFSNYNPNSRYYYNVDNYIGNANSGAASLYLWSVYQYAHSTIRSNIAATSPESNFSGGLDLDGYSYYPVDVSGTVNIKGDIGFHNEEIEIIEGNELSGKGDSYSRTTLGRTQHYLMHAALFRNVSGKININGALSISGSISDTGDYCGALICGTIGGNSSGDATITSNNNGASISLAGIKVHNKDATYSPLLINRASTNVVLDIYNVTASGYSINDEIATSLIGVVGSDTAEKVQVTFNGIKLDGRSSNNSTENNLTAVYGTAHSLFTRATLLESLTYASGSGSFGIYNYEYSEDWGGAPDRAVTYGKEISDNDSVNKGKEYYYYKSFGESAFFTDPSQDSMSAGRTKVYDFSGFLPYVAVWGKANIGNSSTKHQLDVNHSAATFGGCGTYNHPFTIAATDSDKSGGLVTIARILSAPSTLVSGYEIYLPDNIYSPERWCDEQEECEKYTYNGILFEHSSDSSKNKSLADVRKYLAGAYYYLSTNIEIESNSGFTGLGNSSDDYAVFRGVISGNGRTITNMTDAPLIYASNGSVMRNLNVVVKNTSVINLTTASSQTFSSSGGCPAYGAVIGRVLGGDNIIDQVKVDVCEANITYNYLSHAGGYVGVVVNGGVIFRNMDDVHVAPANKAGFGTSGNFASDDTRHLYCNPIIGRVINGYAVNESDAYRPFEDGTRTYGDGTKEYWQSDGSVLSKTKAELDADGTLDTTLRSAAVGVTVKNGNKNYSITDIDPDEDMLDVTSGKVINAPNSQAFFIMSLIINSGMGSKTTPVIGYYGSNQINRHADYSYVRTNIDLTEISTDEYADYQNALADDDLSRLPYLIENYTKGYSGRYYAQNLGSNTYTLSISNDLELPDGYKGIGNINTKNTNLQLSMAGFDGGSKKITQNTTYYSYEKSNDNYLPYVGSIHGIGLFNFILNNADNVTYQKIVLTGNVKTRQYNTDGTLDDYIQQYDATALSAGALFGTLNMNGKNAKISEVYLQDIYVESSSNASGMVGYLINTNTSKKLTIENLAATVNDTMKQSNEIRVSAGTNAGGLISRQGDETANSNNGQGLITIDLHGHHFDFVSVISRCSVNSLDTGAAQTWKQEWCLGAGGLIGPARGGNVKIEIKNVKIGSAQDTASRTVSCEYYSSGKVVQGLLYAGGLVAIANRAPIDIIDCEIYNVNVKSKNYTGGILGWGGTNSSVTVQRCIISNTLDSVVYSTNGNAGCVVGYCKNDMGSITFKNSTIDGYIINGLNAGGVLGDWQASGAFAIQDSIVKNCTINYKNAGGGIAGKLQKDLKGYNVRVSDISFIKQTGGTDNRGYIAGNRSGGTIKIVGFQRTGNITEAKIIGNNTNNKMSDMYNSTGYVIFADYEGKSATDPPGNTTISLIGAAPVTAASPYITVNPSLVLDANINLLTGEAISRSAVNSIMTDTSNKKYNVANLDYFRKDGSINTDMISTFHDELGDVITGKTYDFPMLIVNDTNTAETVVNNYLRLLTNTGSEVDFSTKNSGINASTDIGVVTIRKCAYNKESKTFEISNNANDSCLYLSGNTGNDRTFAIRQVNGEYQYDTANADGQFTLIDVAFKDPSTTGNIAYHLYVPVIVKKLLEYNFDISAISGSTYDQTFYTGNRGNNVVENLGAPVTMEFEYNYLRNAAEWAAEGDTAYGFNKYLSFDPQTTALFNNTTTKLVLVDINRGGKEYYLDKWSDGYNSSTKLLDLQAFKDVSGENFSPVTFADLLSAQNISGTQTLKEKYYLTVFSEKFERTDAEEIKVIHYSVTSPNIGTIEHPTRRVDCADQAYGSYHYVTHLVIGDFYTNTVSVLTPSNSNEHMSNTNKNITVNINVSIDLVNSGTRRLLRDYLGKSNVTIYQSVLASFEKYNDNVIYDKGLTAIDGYTIDSYTLIGQKGNIPVADQQILRTANFIEFQNNTDISDSLQNGSITSMIQATLEFNSERTRNAHFPYRSEGQNTGAIVIGYSNISSNKNNTAYSVVSVSGRDANNRMYYVETEENADLNYYADYSNANKQNQLNEQLGINAREIESEQTKSFIQTEGRYDATGLLDANKAQYLKCSFKLYQKQESGSYSEVSIDSYLDSLNVISEKTPVYTDPFTHTYIFDISDVDQFDNEPNVYKIPITFNVLTGNKTKFKDTYLYSNYKVELTISLFDHDGAFDAVPWTNPMKNSAISDFVIYTNARIYTDLIRAGS